MAVTGPVTEVMRAGGSHIPDLLDRVEQRLGAVAAGHGALLAEHAGTTIAAGGKRLRPLLVFLAADAEDGEGLVRAAAAVELVHSATLVHDDVLDAAALRRGVPTVVADRRARRRHRHRRPALRARVRRAGGQRARRRDPACSPRRRRRWPRASCCSAPTPGTPRCRWSATCAAASSRPRACSRRRAGWARWRPAAPPERARRASGGASAWPSSSSTTCSTSRARSSAPASSAGPTCSTAP